MPNCKHDVDSQHVCYMCLNEENQRLTSRVVPEWFLGIDPAAKEADYTAYQYTCTEHKFNSNDHAEFLQHIDDHHQENRHAKTDD